MRHLNHNAGVLLLVFLFAFSVRPAAAYSVLAHEAIVDSVWGSHIVPLLRAKFPRADAEGIKQARAYAYGGSVIQDLGYYPFGSHYFTNLVHYVRSGDFVETLVRDARDINEYAFALGALAHYASDNLGHPIAVNRSVPLLYPKDRTKFGPEIIYVESPKHHLMVEFAFDVLQVANGAYVAEAYHDFIGFEVAKPLLERAFRETYAMELKDLFLDEDLAIGTYRYAVSTTIPEMTRIAWRDKRDEIQRGNPAATEHTFLYQLNRGQYEKDFGSKYRRPGILGRLAMFTLKVLPKLGPLRTLAFKPLTPAAEKLFLESVARTRDRYGAFLQEARSGRLNLQNTDFDTGAVPQRGRNELADKTYDQLLGDLARNRFATVSPELRRDVTRYYGSTQHVRSVEKQDPKKMAAIQQQLAALGGQR